MDKEELKGLQFVLRYYSPGVFDTRKLYVDIKKHIR